jgi:phospholipase C
VLVINYDEWGGFFDHVVPARAPDVSPRTALRGFRVPALVSSPLARRGHVAHGVYDHTSVLRMIEWRWGLKPLTPRDKAARNLAEVLDLTSPPDLTAPTYTVLPVTPAGCATEQAEVSGSEFAEWSGLKELALRLGWKLPS